MKFLCDMGVSPRVAAWLRDVGHDATHVRDQGMSESPDIEIFRKAAAEDRTVLTFDLDFAEIVAKRSSQDTSVIVFRLQDTRTARGARDRPVEGRAGAVL